MNGTETILLVDDNENDLQLLRTAFKWAQFASPVHAVHNGFEAIAYLKGDGKYADRNLYPLPAVILLDLKMPMSDGFEVLSWIRSQPAFRRLVVIILTTSMREEDIGRAFDLGANSFLVKPSALDDLIGMMRCLRDWLKINHFASLEPQLNFTAPKPVRQVRSRLPA